MVAGSSALSDFRAHQFQLSSLAPAVLQVEVSVSDAGFAL